MAVIHLWTAPPALLDDPALAARCFALLDDEERARNARFRFERNRREDLLARAMIRTVLARYRPVEPEAWRFRRNDHGRPEIDPPCGLRFNLTHHPTLVACAIVDEELDVGVDVEPLARGGSLLALAPRVFAAAELAALRALPDAAQPERAVALWTLKEAYLKARGVGLSLPLGAFAFDLDDPARPAIAFAPPIEDDPARWWFWATDVDGHRVALAAERTHGIPQVQVHAWGLST
jgi:4'-phosphopantetheinyl transferase